MSPGSQQVNRATLKMNDSKHNDALIDEMLPDRTKKGNGTARNAPRSNSRIGQGLTRKESQGSLSQNANPFKSNSRRAANMSMNSQDLDKETNKPPRVQRKPMNIAQLEYSQPEDGR